MLHLNICTRIVLSKQYITNRNHLAVSDLAAMLKSRLHLWRTKGRHMSFPENILVYRDGVSEGQYQLVLENELPLLQKACAETYPADQTKAGLPRITVVVVGKRHHTRFYPTSEDGADRGSNCLPGTVVDRGVTEARNWDFFLQAHAAIKGTARPAHYFVVHDEIFRSRAKGGHAAQQQKRGGAPALKLPLAGGSGGGGASISGNVEDTLEQVTQSLCYVFGRATRAVSICTPAYYADIVCERARRYLREAFDPSGLSDLASVTSGSGSSGGGSKEEEEQKRNQMWQSKININAKLKDTMFYI